MTEPLDLDAIESRAHLPADLPAAILTLARAVRERDADISRLSAEWLDKQRMLIAALEGLAERDAEIARLRELFEATRRWGQHAPPGGDVLELARNTFRSLGVAVVTSEAVEAVASALQQYGDERAAAAKPIAGASATQVASRVWYTEFDGKAKSPGWIIQAYAQVMQAYGDERAAAAIEVLVIDRDKWAALPLSSPCRLTVLNQLNWSIDAIRALAAKPGSET